ncbi:hypothetical protein [Leptolyngbya sp. FACHB-261]|nr:hypothetical protein [Leptolyngbya sp. FACHB-261]
MSLRKLLNAARHIDNAGAIIVNASSSANDMIAVITECSLIH